MKFVDVILPLPLEGVFTYAVPDGMEALVKPGVRLLVPLGKSKTYTGIANAVHDHEPRFEVRDVIAVLDEGQPMLLSRQLRLWQWIADYYMAPIGEVYKAAFPSGLKAEDGYRPKTETFVALSPKYRHEEALRIALSMFGRAQKQRKVFLDYLALSHWDILEGTEPQEEVREISSEELMNVSHSTSANLKSLVDRGLLTTYEREVGRLNLNTEPDFGNIKSLSGPQQDAYNRILMQMMKHRVVLLHGVTSSGKTEIYIHLIHQALRQHQQVLYLLPEIALTVQIMERLQKVFGNRLGIYHSKYSDAERVEIWRKQLSQNPYDIILGARSAVFLPFQRLGLVIIDEEHEASFKQQEPAPRYHARSTAIMLAGMYGAKTLLGTATPSVESYYNASQGKYGLVELKTRYKGMELPEIKVVDVKDFRRRKMMKGPFSPQLLTAVREALALGRQVILFQNRRGFAPMIECRVCGWVPKCSNCDVSLTLHKNTNLLTCHYCGFTYQVPAVCPNCESTEIRGRGYGTEKIEDQIRELFPEARVARMDLDTTRTRTAYERIIDDFSRGKSDILVGTQMVSKGLDFDRVSVVGILDADSMLNYPDFRAYEQAFMMMAQVSGRAGRKGRRGLVLLQTKNASLPVISQVVRNDYGGFYADLLEERRLFRYPPFCRLVYVYLKHAKAEVADTAGIELGSRLRQWFGERVLGPDRPAVARVKSLHIRKLIIKLENGISLERAREYLRLAQRQMMQDKHYATLQIYYDVDPL
ncbi:primosomal protein N' [Prevotella sp. oral taxon 376]|uniref:replication restart helicase PriA n=1 Tax=Prevotella sp. oral taxon 376 TaxID=712466 RepID=UPI000D1E759D|nr:primosomal protein N' [Prevotella sp. oral taxon 376]PTL34090.1 primosomal protein N' [Prevotella sp. oral taxon 376]